MQIPISNSYFIHTGCGHIKLTAFKTENKSTDVLNIHAYENLYQLLLNINVNVLKYNAQ
jgi:hypothetical protein